MPGGGLLKYLARGMSHALWVTELSRWKELNMPGGLLKYLGGRMKPCMVGYRNSCKGGRMKPCLVVGY